MENRLLHHGINNIVLQLLRSDKWLKSNGDPEWIRTSDLRIRSPLLYPAELRGRFGNAVR